MSWAAILRAYESEPGKLTEIAERFGVSRQLIQARAKSGGWRRAGKDRKSGTNAAPDSNASGRALDEQDAGLNPEDLAKVEEASGARRRRMVARLFKALEEKMTQMEKRIARGGEAVGEESAADSEREARALGALAGLYAKLVALDEAAADGEAEVRGAEKRQNEAAGDADQFREDLARRLERLHQARDA